MHIAKDMLLVALILTMIAGIILGMGIPTTPAYIIMTALLVPAIVKLGVVEPAAHMFAFYFAILSAITPPVALAVFAACGIAKSDLWSSGWAAVKIGAAGLIVPFMFVYEPALLMIGPWPKVCGARRPRSPASYCLPLGSNSYLITLAPFWQRLAADCGGTAADQARARLRSRRRRACADRRRDSVADQARGGQGRDRGGIADRQRHYGWLFQKFIAAEAVAPPTTQGMPSAT